MLAQDEKIIRKTFTKRSKKNLLWNEQVTIPCDIFDALPVNFNLSFFPLAEKNMLLLTFARLHSVAAAGTGQNKSTKLI